MARMQDDGTCNSRETKKINQPSLPPPLPVRTPLATEFLAGEGGSGGGDMPSAGRHGGGLAIPARALHRRFPWPTLRRSLVRAAFPSALCIGKPTSGSPNRTSPALRHESWKNTSRPAQRPQRSRIFLRDIQNVPPDYSSPLNGLSNAPARAPPRSAVRLFVEETSPICGRLAKVWQVKHIFCVASPNVGQASPTFGRLPQVGGALPKPWPLHFPVRRGS